MIPVYNSEQTLCAYLRPLTADYCATMSELPTLVAKWRNTNKDWFLTSFHATEDGSKTWLDNIIQSQNRLLFIVEDLCHHKIGHIGYAKINHTKKSGEIDAVIRGEASDTPMLMTHGLNALLAWGRTHLQLQNISLTVLSHNHSAIKLYKRCGFRQMNEIPLRKANRDGKIIFEDAPELKESEYYKLVMFYEG